MVDVNTTRYILGVDPGLKGAFAFLPKRVNAGKGNAKKINPERINEPQPPPILFKMPLTHSQGKKSELDLKTLVADTSDLLFQTEYAAIELVGAWPGAGVTGMFRFGFFTGALHGVISSHNVPIVPVRPSVWKVALGLGRDKKAARTKAASLFPELSDMFSYVDDDGLSEALLIACFARDRL